MEHVWRQLIVECCSLESFNRFIVPLMRVETPEFKRIAAEEAKRRSYTANKEKGLYELANR
jgi:hypothetical protein